jgi:hypothetical protein
VNYSQKQWDLQRFCSRSCAAQRFVVQNPMDGFLWYLYAANQVNIVVLVSGIVLFLLGVLITPAGEYRGLSNHAA